MKCYDGDSKHSKIGAKRVGIGVSRPPAPCRISLQSSLSESLLQVGANARLHVKETRID